MSPKKLPFGAEPAAGPDRWYVTNGTKAVGPVNSDLLARGIEAGKVPLSSFVRHEGWTGWRQLSELMTGVYVDETPIPISTEPRRDTDDVAASARPPREDESLPADAFAGASDLKEAMLLLLAASVQQTGASAALIHEVRLEEAIVTCAHGERMFEALGARTSLLDPAVLAAAAGATVVAEPEPGPAGRRTLVRLAQLGAPVAAAVMLPIRPYGCLHAILELGRFEAFRPREIAQTEALVEAFVATIEAAGWEPASAARLFESP
jgi:hypothetical protein